MEIRIERFTNGSTDSIYCKMENNTQPLNEVEVRLFWKPNKNNSSKHINGLQVWNWDYRSRCPEALSVSISLWYDDDRGAKTIFSLVLGHQGKSHYFTCRQFKT